MKNKIIIIVLIFSANIYAQIIEPQAVKITEETQIEYQLHKLQLELNKQFKKEVNEGKEPTYLKIKLNDIEVNKDKAAINCDIIFGDYKESKLLKKQKLEFSKNKTWSLEKYPHVLEERIKKIKIAKEENKNKLNKSSSKFESTSSIEEVSIQLSEDVFIPYPIFEHPDDGDIFEIDYGLTEKEFGIQLFAGGQTGIDGCAYYLSYINETTYDRVVFYADPGWRRIIFSRETNGEYSGIYDYKGDANVDLKTPIAIDVNEYGELFVLDDDAHAVFKLQYNSSTNKITSTSNSKIINSQYIEKPSDICFSNRGTFNNPNDDFIAVTDLKRKSIMLFNSNGSFLHEYTEYSGMPITKPKSIEIEDKSEYPSMYFVDDQKVVRATIYNDWSINAHFSQTFPENSDINGIGLFSIMGEVDGIIVADERFNMLHLLDPIYSQYICSYCGPSAGYFVLPRRVFSTAYAHYDHSNAIRLDFFTMDDWARVRGIKRFVPGGDIQNLEVKRGYFKYILTYDEAFVQDTQIDLYRHIDGNNWYQVGEDVSPYAYDWNMADDHLYKWVVKYRPKYDYLYQGYGIGWQTKEIEFTTNHTIPSIIDEDIAIRGNYEVNSNVTIYPGVKFEIIGGSGTTITFNNNSSIQNYGTLEISGDLYTYPFNTTLDFVKKNGSIYSYQGSNVKINGATIKNAYYGIRAEYSTPEITNSYFQDCKYGVFLYKTNMVSGDPIILNNRFENIDNWAIYHNNSSSRIRGNEIKNSYGGVFCYYLSSPYLGEVEHYGNNKIYDNGYGIYAYNNSDPFLGRNTCTTPGGNNSVYNNTNKNVYVSYNGSFVQAENTWWGSAPPNYSKFYIGSGGGIDYTPYLTGNPLQKSSGTSNSPEETVFNNVFAKDETSNLNQESTSKKYNYDKKWPLDWKILYIRNLVLVEDYKYAQKLCEEIIDKYPDSAQTFTVLNLYLQASKNYDVDSFVKYLTKKMGDKKLTNLYGMMELMIEDFTDLGFKKADKYEKTLAKYENKEFEETVLFHNFTYNLIELNNIEEARKISDKLDRKNKESELALEAHRLLGDEVIDPKNLPKSSNEETTIVNNYELLGNYPNPFNPSTTISYAIPFVSKVNLDIYDISGSLVKSFEISSQSAGRHQIIWDGTNELGLKVSSGIYLYKFRAISYEGNGNPLANGFEKTAKLLLMK